MSSSSVRCMQSIEVWALAVATIHIKMLESLARQHVNSKPTEGVQRHIVQSVAAAMPVILWHASACNE